MQSNQSAFPPAAFGVGEIVDNKYRLVRVIGEGGWGVVFEGENTRTLKRLAVKILRTQAHVGPDAVARFEREAQAAGRIGSEHIVEVLDVGALSDGTLYLVMELLAGESLAQRLANRGPADPITAVQILAQALDGLTAAHRAGIVHRDLKPENMFLVPTRSGKDFVKLLDFGVSKFSIGPLANMTMTGAVLGTPYYMAPEQARGQKDIGPPADLYAAGAVLFECLTGRAPFEGDNFNDLMFKIVTGPRPSPLELRPELDPALAAIVVKAISVDPVQRFASATAFREALVSWLDTQGNVSSRTPELQRWMKSTPPPGDGLVLASIPTPAPSKTAVTALGTTRDVVGSHKEPKTDTGASGLSPRAALLVTAGGCALVLGGALLGSRLLPHETHTESTVAVMSSSPAASNGAPLQAEVTVGSQTPAAVNSAIRDALVDVTIKATPTNAKLFLDNVPLSGNPSVGRYPKDMQPHSLRVEAPHYYTQTAVVPFDSQSHVVEINLQRVPPPPPPAPPLAPAPSKN